MIKESIDILFSFDTTGSMTSPNRKLLGGTKFLYEVEDWDRA